MDAVVICRCGTPFVPTHHRHRWCPACREAKSRPDRPRFVPVPLVCECGRDFTPTHHMQRRCVACQEARKMDYYANEWAQPFLRDDEQGAWWALALRDVQDRERAECEAAVEVALREGASGLAHHERPWAAEILDLGLHADRAWAHVDLVTAVEMERDWPRRIPEKHRAKPKRAKPSPPKLPTWNRREVRPHELFESVIRSLRKPIPAAVDALELMARPAIGLVVFVGYDATTAYFRTQDDDLVRVLTSTPWVAAVLGGRISPVELTSEQASEVERLVNEGVPRDQAVSIATETQLDVVIDGSGTLEPLPISASE